MPVGLRPLLIERERLFGGEEESRRRREGLDLGGGVGLRDAMEGERLLGRLLGEREREVSECVKDLFRSPRLGLLLRSLSLP